MAGNIKGVIIQFRGDTTPLQKAIRQVDSEIKKTRDELSQIDRALKFNPSSVELWKVKQQALTQQISQTDEKLEILKKGQKEMDAAGVDKNSAEYRNLQREIIETESKLKHFNAELRNIGNANLQALGEKFKSLGSSLEEAGQKMRAFSAAGAAAAASIGALAYKSGQWADDLNTMSKVYGIGTDELQKYAASAELVDVDVETIAKSHQKLTRAMSGAEDETGAQAEAFKRLGISVVDANGELRDSDEVWNDVIVALGEVENETERDALAMELMGKSAAELNPLIEDGGKTYEQTAKIFKKYGLDIVDQDTLNRANQFNDQLSLMKAIGATAFQQLGTQLSAYLAPFLEKVVDLVGRLAQWLTNLDPRILAIIGAVGGFIALAAPVLTGLGKIAAGIGALTKAIGVLQPIVSAILTNPYVLVIGAIIAAGVALYKNWDTIKKKLTELWNKVKAVFASIKSTIVNTWNAAKTAVMNAVNAIKTTVSNVFSTIYNTISSKVTAAKTAISNAFTAAKNTVSTLFNSMKTTITSVIDAIKSAVSTTFNAIKSLITSPIDTAVNLVSNAISRLRSILSGSISFPHIKLPHFRIVGQFSLMPPSVPHLSVDWYKQGGIFSSPSVIGVGEAGSEAVVPLDTLWSKMDRIADAAGSTGGGITINVYGAAGQNVNELAAAVERRLVNLQKQQAKAW